MYYASLATVEDREQIYRLRYEIYAKELGQYPEKAERKIQNQYDEVNEYFVIKDSEQEIIAFISVTPPNKYGLSSVNHLKKINVTYDIDPNAYEMRLLTVVKSRGLFFSFALVYLVISWIKYQGGNTIVGIGRTEVVNFYKKCGAYPVENYVLYLGKVEYRFLEADIVKTVNPKKDYFMKLIKRFDSNLDWGNTSKFIEDDLYALKSN